MTFSVIIPFDAQTCPRLNPKVSVVEKHDSLVINEISNDPVAS